jgi:hypothetical protein
MKINSQTIHGGSQQFADTITNNTDNSRHQSMNGNVANGNVNFGDNSNQSNSITGTAPENEELKTQLQELIASSNLPAADKQDALAEAQKLAEAAAQPKEEQPDLVRKTLRYFKGLAGDLEGLPETALKLGGMVAQIGALFGLLR